MTLSQQNWEREREDMQEKEAYTKREFEAAKQAMQDWEVLAMEERSHRDHLAERVSDLEEQLASQREAYEKAAAERDGQSLTVDGLQRAMKEIQDGKVPSIEAQADWTQLGNENSESWWRTHRPKSRSFGRSWKKLKQVPMA